VDPCLLDASLKILFSKRGKRSLLRAVIIIEKTEMYLSL